MSAMTQKNRMAWLAIGTVAGICLSHLWPHEPALAVTTDRNEKFALATADITLGGQTEAIFTLDFLTGQLRGRVLNSRIGDFSYSYFRNVAKDFDLDPSLQPYYTIVSGKTTLPNRRGISMAQSVVYVAELTTGKVIAYAFPFTEIDRVVQEPIQMLVVGDFKFREAIAQ